MILFDEFVLSNKINKTPLQLRSLKHTHMDAQEEFSLTYNELLAKHILLV